ncbi:MAG: hypothetical protein WB580_04835 [Candidatus Binataceae bacterium]
MMRDALAHLLVERFGRGDEKAARTCRLLRQRERVCAFTAARAAGYQRYGAHLAFLSAILFLFFADLRSTLLRCDRRSSARRAIVLIDYST